MDKKPYEVFDIQIVKRLSGVLKKIDDDMLRMSKTVSLPNSTVRRIYKLEVSSVKPGIVFQIKSYYPKMNTGYIFSGEGEMFVEKEKSNLLTNNNGFDYLNFIDEQGKLISELKKTLEEYKKREEERKD